MNENLQRLTRALRAERCPPRILETVQSRIAREPASAHAYRLSMAAFAVCLFALAAVLAFWAWPNRDVRSLSQTAVTNHADQVRVAQEAGAALGYIGSLLMDAGKHTQNALVNDAAPPLWSGFEAVSKTLNKKL